MSAPNEPSDKPSGQEGSDKAGSPGAPSSRTPETDLRDKVRQEGWAVPIDRIDAFTMGAALSVEPDKIQQELLALWRKAAERAKREGSRFEVARACLWNLIVHADGDAEFYETKRLLDEISETVPARILALHETWHEDPNSVVGDDGAPLRAFVEANFRRTSSGRREIVAEEITLEASRLHSHRLPGLVRALLLPDVPTALVVRNPAADSHWLPRIAPEVDRFVFDSGKLDSAAGLLRVARVLGRLFPQSAHPAATPASLEGHPHGPSPQLAIDGFEPSGPKTVEIADLGWLRLWPWRALIASQFDAPQDAAVLPRLDRIEIHHVPGAGPAALLLAGWLMGRLRLRPALGSDGAGSTLSGLLGDGEVLLQRRERSSVSAGRHAHGGPRLRLRLVESPARTTPAGISSVSLHAKDVCYAAHGSVTEESRCVTLRSPSGTERVQPVHGRRDAELMVAAMGVGGRDPLMYEALRLGTALLHEPHHSSPASPAPPAAAQTDPGTPKATSHT
ncbi:MAG: glucose-6-phosphate dehydrogenase assembly protein OpcA [Polyangia bacterium]